MPSNAPRSTPQSQHVPPPVSLPQPTPPPIPTQHAAAMPRIKTEPGSNGQPSLPNMNSQVPMQAPGQAPNPQAARDRAASHLQNKFGAAASHSVSQLQSQGQAPQQYAQMHAPNGQIPQIKQESSYPSLGSSQTDGASDPLTDWKAEAARRREAAQNGQGDHILREHLKQQMRGLEGGGLLRPLSELGSSSSASRHTAASVNAAAGSGAPSSVPKVPGQFDGADDGSREEADEDAINSDLDDPDDLIAEDAEADESEGQVMLCTYDKVQRVKNKWKCTLKDGILTTGGREYVHVSHWNFPSLT